MHMAVQNCCAYAKGDKEVAPSATCNVSHLNHKTTTSSSSDLHGNHNSLLKINQFDIDQPRREYLFSLPDVCTRFIVKHLLRRQDEKNLYIFLVGVNVILCSLPAAAALYYAELTQAHHSLVPQWQFCLFGLVYSLGHCKIFGRSFLLALHFISHCSIFNARFRFLDHIWTSFLCSFFGVPPGLYYPHHIGMHHYMDNMGPQDMSSTMEYDRSSKWHHFKYMLRFVTMGGFELPYRLIQLKKYNLVVQCVSGCIFYWTSMGVGFCYAPLATLFVFFIPWLICSFPLMQGNFKEHIFVDPQDPHNNYKSAFTCINTPHNAVTFNSGYHLEHHQEPGLPWYRLPELFLRNIDKHAANDSFIFSGLSVMQVGNLVLYDKFEQLADAYVNVGQVQRTRSQLIAEFKRRLHPINSHHSHRKH